MDDWKDHPDALDIKVLFLRFCGEHNCRSDNDSVNYLVEMMIRITEENESPLEATDRLIRNLRNPTRDIDKVVGKILMYKATGGKFKGKFDGNSIAE